MTALLVAAALFASQTNADAVNPPPEKKKPAATNTLSDSDVHVLTMLHARNAIENELGHLAKAQAGSKQVRAFGAMVAKDHAFLDKSVLKLVRKAGIELQPWQGKNDDERRQLIEMQDTVAQLKTLKGDAFDRLFVSSVERWHDADIAAVEAQRSLTTESHVYALLGKILPVLREHRAVAEKIAGRNDYNG
jgi:putative membrane protein